MENAEEIVLEEPRLESMPVVFLMDRFGYVRTVDESVYERNREAADGESRYVLHCMNTDRICIFTDTGKEHLLKVADVPHGKFRDKGTPLDNLCNYDSSIENFVAVIPLNDIADTRVTFVTAQGMVKQVQGKEFDVSKRTVAATKLQEGDVLLAVYAAPEQTHVVLATDKGYFLRFPAADIPEKKKGAVGVRGLKLSQDDKVTDVYWLGGDKQQEIVYREKSIPITRLKIAARDGKGTRLKL